MSEISKEEKLEAAMDQMENLQVPPTKPQKSSDDKGAATSVWSLLAVIFSLIAIGIASYGAFMAFELKQSTSASNPQHPDTLQSLSRLRSSIQSIEDRSINMLTQEKLDLSIANQQSSLSTARKEIDTAFAGLKQSLGTSSEDWLLAEAEYLIRLANQHVKMEQDAAGALTLLSTADEIIEDARGIAAYDLRKSLAEDMAALKSVVQLDTDGVFVQLGALVSQVGKLEQKKLKFEVVTQGVLEIDENMELFPRVMAFFRAAGTKLGSLVDYRRDGDLVTPILPPQEDYYLRQNLVMKMQHAQLALLRRNQQIFDSSLLDSIAWIDQYFDPHHSVSIAMLSTLHALQNVQVETSIPEISGSLREIRKLMAGFSTEAVGSNK